MTANLAHFPLAGLRILDFFWLGAGPTASQVFRQFGADVIKVESTRRLDKLREGGPYPGEAHYDHSGLFASLNAGKRSITIDPGQPLGRKVALDLAGVSDIVTSNFRPFQLDSWQLGYDDLRRVNPNVIVLSMSSMGREGPYAGYGAYGSHLAAGSGFTGLTGYEGEVPYGVGALYPDFSCNPFHALTALLCALRLRDQGHGGQFIDVSQFESTMNVLGPAFAEYCETHVEPLKYGNKDPYLVPHGVYRCSDTDTWIAIAVSSDQEWASLAALIDATGVLARTYPTFLVRKRHAVDIDTIVSNWASKQDKWKASAKLRVAGVPAWPVETLADQLDHPESSMAGAYDLVEDPRDAVTYCMQKLPVHIDGVEPALLPPPHLGEHNFEILQELLGYSDDELTHVIASGAIS